MKLSVLILAAAATLVLAGCGSSTGDGDGDGPADTADVPLGPPAVWDLAAGPRLTSTTTSFTADVTRLACNSGVTGDVAEPRIEVESSRVVVTFSTVEPDATAATCQGNRPVQHVVHLDGPLGDRTLVDGRCLPGGAAETTSLCGHGGVRWRPSGLSTDDAALVAGSRAATNAPDGFAERSLLTDCGEVRLQPAEKLPLSAVRCLEDADGPGAELVAVVPTIDDGLYVVYYRGGGTFEGLETFTDGSRSPFGAFWQHESCTTLRSLRTMTSGDDCRLVDQTG